MSWRQSKAVTDSMRKMLVFCFGLALEVPAGENNPQSSSSKGRSSGLRKQREARDSWTVR